MENHGLKVEILEVAGIKSAMKGMRNPKNSWYKNDTVYKNGEVIIGENDMKLARMLIAGGTEHRKFLRQIMVTIDVTMPRYWWAEADTYTFGTKNSCSTMHKLFDKNKKIYITDFYNPVASNDIYSDWYSNQYSHLASTVMMLNELADAYFDNNLDLDKNDILRMAKAILPESFLQLRTWTTNYEELRNIVKQRKNHRLKEEWGTFINSLKDLPYADELIFN